MYHLVKCIMIIIFILILQLSIYDLFLKPVITVWGASEKEVSMLMAGDNDALLVTSTRSIVINAPKHVVWQWLMQLGADRGGFYSYDFIEKALGYKIRYPNLTEPMFKNLKTGDIVRGSIDERSSIIPYNFRVLYIKPEDTFVLQNWGTFLLEGVNDQQTRLLIRTQEVKSSNLFIRFRNYFSIPFHFIMERRLLIGFKARAEGSKDTVFSQNKDIFWFGGITSSWILIFSLVFIGCGVFQSAIIPSILGMFWLMFVFLLPPTPFNSMALLSMICLTVLCVIRARAKKKNDRYPS